MPAGCKVPVVHLANGTGASCSNYQQVLNQLASYGFLAACYEDPNTGAGTQGHFKKLPDGDKWDKRKAQNEKPCQ